MDSSVEPNIAKIHIGTTVIDTCMKHIFDENDVIRELRESGKLTSVDVLHQRYEALGYVANVLNDYCDLVIGAAVTPTENGTTVSSRYDIELYRCRIPGLGDRYVLFTLYMGGSLYFELKTLANGQAETIKKELIDSFRGVVDDAVDSLVMSKKIPRPA